MADSPLTNQLIRSGTSVGANIRSDILEKCIEVKKLLVTSINTAKGKLNNQSKR